MSIYNNDELSIVYLDYLGVSRKRIHDLLKIAPSPYNVLKQKFTSEVEAILGKTKAIDIKTKELDDCLKKLEKYLEDRCIRISTIISSDFPEFLKEIKPAPALLYYKGDFSLTKNDHMLGVVGTRKPTNYGRNITKKFVKEVVEGGLITISGLAYGVDSEVARTTLECSGKHIAVLGGGLNSIYPSSNTNLAEDIIKNGGLILSEYFPSMRPAQYTFPDRNRIISGLSKGVLVIEAGMGSGSLITASSAIEQNKEVFVVPANIDNQSFAGSNALIQEIPTMFTSNTDHIFEVFGIEKVTKEKPIVQLSVPQTIVVNALLEGEKTVDELCEILKEDFKTGNLLLTELEIGGIIKKLPGDYYCLV